MFQFQIGAIGSIAAVDSYNQLLSFNSRLVRLVEETMFHHLAYLFSFNSRLVRLVESYLVATVFTVKGFNSRLVRLVGCPAVGEGDDGETFQFQIGAIGSILIPVRSRPDCFVSIPDWCDW